MAERKGVKLPEFSTIAGSGIGVLLLLLALLALLVVPVSPILLDLFSHSILPYLS